MLQIVAYFSDLFHEFVVKVQFIGEKPGQVLTPKCNKIVGGHWV